jgi:hypothetical protein
VTRSEFAKRRWQANARKRTGRKCRLRVPGKRKFHGVRQMQALCGIPLKPSPDGQSVLHLPDCPGLVGG